MIYKRHLAKTITWRIIASLDTLIISWIITNSISTGITISIIEIITKMILYFFHEKIWYNSEFKNHRIRHLFKTFTWRIIGTLDTVILASFITSDPVIGLKIGSLETITKIVLYYIHEKVWYKSDFYLESRIK